MHTRMEELAPIIRLVTTIHLQGQLLENYLHPLNINLLSLLLSVGTTCTHTAPHVLPPPLHTLHTQHTTHTITAKPKEGETKKENIQERENNRPQLGWGIHHFLVITPNVSVKRRGKEREKGRGNARENSEKENGKEKEREKRNHMLTLTHIDKAPLPLCLVTTLLLTPLHSNRPGLIPSLSNNNSPFPLLVPQPSTRYSFSFRPNSSYKLSSLLHSSNRVKSHQLSCREMEQWRST